MPIPSKLLRWSWLTGLMLSLEAVAQLAVAPSAVVTTPQVRAELVAHAPQGLDAGQPVWLGLKIKHQPHWHTYWKNPGDSGLPTTLTWTLPAGASASDIDWPAPHRLPIGPLMNYGYEGTLLLPVTLALPAGAAETGLEVKLRAEWLVCKDVCIPEGGDFVLKLPAQTAIASHAALFDAARAAAPRPLPEARTTATVEGSALQVRVDGLPPAWQGKTLSFFPETPGVINNAAVLQARWQGGRWEATVPLDVQRSASPTAMPVVLRLPQDQGSVLVNVAVTGSWPTVAAPAALPSLVAEGGAPLPAAAPVSLPWALLLALAGGALLNLMPCVFPVLSLKMLAVAGKGADRRALLAGGVAYTAGVMLSFLALAGLLLALRAGGEQLGWGFQLQSPVVVAVLAGLFTLIGLNLAGVFELGSVLPSSWMAARSRHPIVDSAVTGVLAVAVASPCTAPFMGASLGLAVTLPTGQALSVFAALGLGMALPYLAATAWPPLARALPRPGVWMVHFKTAMAFPMFATVVWLVWVLGQQSGIDGAAALLGLLLALAFAAWGLGSASLGPRARIGFGALSVALLVAGAAWAVPLLRHEAPPTNGVSAAGERWQPWSPERVAQAHAEGRIVFVDFTAAWCVTCQINKRTLNDSAVVAAFDARKVLLLRADWTRRDAVIAAELSRLGRSGVPVYAFYAPGDAGPRVLSEILSSGEILAALSATPL